MIRYLFISLILIFPLFPPHIQAIIPDPALGNLAKHKILIAYFSYSRNTEKVSRQIHNLTGGVLYRIMGLEPYLDLSKEEVKVRALRELEDNARPKIFDRVYNMESYDIIFLGYPIWENTLPMIINTFLESYNFSGKIIIPFTTRDDENIDFGESLEAVTGRVPLSIVFQGFSAIQGQSDREFVLKYLKRTDKEVEAVEKSKKYLIKHPKRG